MQNAFGKRTRRVVGGDANNGLEIKWRRVNSNKGIVRLLKKDKEEKK